MVILVVLSLLLAAIFFLDADDIDIEEALQTSMKYYDPNSTTTITKQWNEAQNKVRVNQNYYENSTVRDGFYKIILAVCLLRGRRAGRLAQVRQSVLPDTQ